MLWKSVSKTKILRKMSENKTITSKPAWRWHYQRGSHAVIRKSSRTGKLIVKTVIAFAVAALLAFGFHRILFACIVAGIGCLILICGLFFPKLYASFERVIGKFAFGVGQVLTWILLVPFYYLCFLPARILLSCTKRDPMKRAWDSSASTYWDKKQDIQVKNRMTKQY